MVAVGGLVAGSSLVAVATALRASRIELRSIKITYVGLWVISMEGAPKVTETPGVLR